MAKDMLAANARKIALDEWLQDRDSIQKRNKVVAGQLGLVHMVVKKFKTDPAIREDLIQEGMIGIMRAMNTFDTSYNVKFSTYVVYWIRVYMQRYMIRIDAEKYSCLKSHVRPSSAVEKARAPEKLQHQCSLDQPVSDDMDSCLLGDIVTNDNEPLIDEQVSQAQRARMLGHCIEKSLSKLKDKRIRMIVEERFFQHKPTTLNEIGKSIGLSSEGVRLKQNAFYSELKKQVNALQW